MAAKADTTQIEKDWQLNKSLAECNRHMLENRIATDVTFLVSDENTDSESQTFSAHNYMLISRSPVFYSMLCGDLAETGQIRVTDVEPQAFRQMLNYIYTDSVDLSLDLVVHVINASKKYLLPGLTTKCAEFIKGHLGTENVCTILNQILLFEENDLNEFCLDLIMKETKKVVESKAFFSISRDALSKILGIKSCALKEVDLFKACIKWGRQKCEEEKKEATGINIRAALGDSVSHFRFSDRRDFARDVCCTGVLTISEEHGILRHLADTQEIAAPTGFCCETRLFPVYTVQTIEDIQHIECDEFDFSLNIRSKNTIDINVNSILIGKVCGGDIKPITSYSIKYNDANVTVDVTITQDEKKVQLKCNSPLIIKPGSSTLQITYQQGNAMDVLWSKHMGQFYTTKAANVHGVPRKKMILKDEDRLELDVIASDRFIPFLGLTYNIKN